MNTSDEVRSPRAQTGSGQPTYPAAGRGWWRWLRHYLEMVAAMLVGVVVLGGVARSYAEWCGVVDVPIAGALAFKF